MKAVLEGILFLVGEDGIKLDDLVTILNVDKENAVLLLRDLKKDYEDDSRGITIKRFGELFKLTTKSEHKSYYERLVDISNVRSLSQSALETLAIIAYNEPITRVEVDELRGVSSAQIIRNLVAKDLVKEVGKSEKVGRPILYGITKEFLDYFGIESKDKLPKIEEIKVKDDEIDLYDSKYKEEKNVEEDIEKL